MVPPGSWSGNSNSGPTKQNGHSTTTRLGSADLGTPFSGIWAPEKAGLPADLKDEDPPGPLPADPVLDYAAVTRGQFLTFSSSGNTLKSNASDKAVRRGSKIKSISRWGVVLTFETFLLWLGSHAIWRVSNFFCNHAWLYFPLVHLDGWLII